MNIDEWLSQVSQACQAVGRQLSSDESKFLLENFPEKATEDQKKTVAELYQIMFRYFFDRVPKGSTFGSLLRIKETFGKTLEENYGLSDGPFIAMAKTYWTFKLELDDILDAKINDYVLTQILFKIESQIRSLFFPTPGPYKTPPVSLRRETQREMLQEYVPSIDIEKFLFENPILKKLEREEKRTGLGILRRLFGRA